MTHQDFYHLNEKLGTIVHRLVVRDGSLRQAIEDVSADFVALENQQMNTGLKDKYTQILSTLRLKETAPESLEILSDEDIKDIATRILDMANSVAVTNWNKSLDQKD